jgi:hypothetical protein
VQEVHGTELLDVDIRYQLATLSAQSSANWY